MDIAFSFGYWIRRQRKAHDLTQQMLADLVGCSLAAIKKIEGDERRPSRQIAERLADSLQVPLEQREIFVEVARGLRPIDALTSFNKGTVTIPPTELPLPSGTVTFLYTDIEGSTPLWEQRPDEMSVAQVRHDAILREAIQSNNGYIFQVVGDEFSSAFKTALDAIHAAVKSQINLHGENWGETPIHVRMGIHTGKAEVQKDGQYIGFLTLSYVQRLASVGYGGQVLVSSIAQQLVRDSLPEGVELIDLGWRKIKEGSKPERIYQLLIHDLPADFPLLKLTESFPSNLPAQLTSFIGRKREISEIEQLFSTTRLLTLTGPGGTGKTRLSLQFAAKTLEKNEYPDGIWHIELAPITDPNLVTQTIASVLGIREQPGRKIIDVLIDYVRSRTMILILDNCEHLIEACAQLTETFLRVSPNLKILASSRESLGITGETAYRVPSLPLPDRRRLQDLDDLLKNDCVRLFIERALAVHPDFRINEKNGSAIADICRRLDGIPLAIELAAARIRVFSPQEISARLDDRFRLLTGGSRTGLERHQTLRSLIDWSYNLLTEDERTLLRRLSVFAEDWTVQAIDVVCCTGLDAEALELLTHLIDKSLVVVSEGDTGLRYHLPETIRQYARDRLLESGESERMRDLHLEFYLQFAMDAEPKLRGADQVDWLERLDIEHDNLRYALVWSIETNQREKALQLAVALFYFWEMRGYWSEGHKWLRDALAVASSEQQDLPLDEETLSNNRKLSALHAKALYCAARLFQNITFDLNASQVMLEEALSLFRKSEDKWWTAVALQSIAVYTIFKGDFNIGRNQLEEAVALAREVEDRWPLAKCLIRLASPLMRIDMITARRVLEEGLALAHSLGDNNLISQGLLQLNSINFMGGSLDVEKLADAQLVAIEALQAARVTGGNYYIVISMIELVIISCFQGDLGKATQYCVEILTYAHETGNQLASWHATVAFGIVASFTGQPGLAVRLLTVFENLLRHQNLELNLLGGPMVLAYKMFLEKARSQLPQADFELAQLEGRNLTLEQALVIATDQVSAVRDNQTIRVS